jgi:phage repressor protein C with HTH and peptisase S24 domain
VKYARDKRGMTQADLADAMGVNSSIIGGLESRNGKSSRHTSAMAKVLGVNTEWLLGGEGSSGIDDDLPISDNSSLTITGGFDTWDEKTPLSSDEIALPFYEGVELAAGDGCMAIASNTDRKLRFSKRTLQNANVQIKDAITMKINGDSMERLIVDGATIGVDTSKAAEPIKDNKIYALETSGMLRCKYLQRLAGDRIRVYSENKLYNDEEYSMTEFCLLYRIIGGVFWWSTIDRW